MSKNESPWSKTPSAPEPKPVSPPPRHRPSPWSSPLQEPKRIVDAATTQQAKAIAWTPDNIQAAYMLIEIADLDVKLLQDYAPGLYRLREALKYLTHELRDNNPLFPAHPKSQAQPGPPLDAELTNAERAKLESMDAIDKEFNHTTVQSRDEARAILIESNEIIEEAKQHESPIIPFFAQRFEQAFEQGRQLNSTELLFR